MKPAKDWGPGPNRDGAEKIPTEICHPLNEQKTVFSTAVDPEEVKPLQNGVTVPDTADVKL